VKLGVARGLRSACATLFGPSGICNVLGAIKLAKHLRLGPGDNVVTVATDGFDRYNSVLDDLNRRYLELTPPCWTAGRTTSSSAHRRPRLRLPQARRHEEQLFQQKEHDWIKFGYTKQFLDTMRSQDFWDAQYAKVRDYNQKISAARQLRQPRSLTACSSSR
jgi:cysteine synthase A